MRITAPKAIALLKVGLALVSINLSVDAALAMAAGHTGAALVDAGLAIVYGLLSMSDLGMLWQSRRLPLREVMIRDARATSNWFRLGGFLSHCLIVAGMYLQI